MFLDITGLFLTILIISPRYWFIVTLISIMELVFSICITTALHYGVTEVIAGGIFSSIAWSSEGRDILQLAGPVFLFITGSGLLKHTRISWIDLINPVAGYKKPWPVLMIKTAIFRLIVFFLFIRK